jgi:hypothetical protein
VRPSSVETTLATIPAYNWSTYDEASGRCGSLRVAIPPILFVKSQSAKPNLQLSSFDLLGAAIGVHDPKPRRLSQMHDILDDLEGERAAAGTDTAKATQRC